MERPAGTPGFNREQWIDQLRFESEASLSTFYFALVVLVFVQVSILMMQILVAPFAEFLPPESVFAPIFLVALVLFLVLLSDWRAGTFRKLLREVYRDGLSEEEIAQRYSDLTRKRFRGG